MQGRSSDRMIFGCSVPTAGYRYATDAKCGDGGSMAVYLGSGLVWMVGSAWVAIALGRCAAHGDRQVEAYYADVLAAQASAAAAVQTTPRSVASEAPRRGDLFARQAR